MRDTEKTLVAFADDLSSSLPSPGGGGAAALAGALAAALASMVGALTTGKPKFADLEEDLREWMEQLAEIRRDLLRLIDEDAENFAPLAAAYSIPKDDPGRAEILERATRDACQAPLDILRACARAVPLIRNMAERGSRMVVSDAGCAAALARAAMEAAALNVYVNTRTLADADMAEDWERMAREVVSVYGAQAQEVYDRVQSYLTGGA